MISVTTPTVENGVIVEYKGIVTGYEEELESARLAALAEMESHAVRLGANAVVGVNIDYEVLGQGNMLMVSATGTAVVVQNK